MTVAELLGRISSAELAEWMALYKLEYDESLERGLEQRAVAKVEARRRRR